MLHTKFHGNRHIDLRKKKIFEGYLHYMGVAAIFVMIPRYINAAIEGGST